MYKTNYKYNQHKYFTRHKSKSEKVPQLVFLENRGPGGDEKICDPQIEFQSNFKALF